VISTGTPWLMNHLLSQPISAHAHTSRRDLIDHALDAAQATTSVFTTLYPDAARAVAMHTDVMRDARVALSPLAGLPVSVKDLCDVAGEPTLAGSVVLKDAAPAKCDAQVVQRLRAAGAAIIGKTNMTEFAYSGLGLNPHYGTPVNPVDQRIARIPGGSSSGAAVSVAAGICVAGIGSDTGGSIRIPAAFCGLVGFKPTARRVPTAGTVPLSTTLDTICAMTRSVDDGIIADTPLSVAELPLSGLRLGVPQTMMLDGLDAHVATSFSAALARLSAAGAQIIDIPLTLLDDFNPLRKFSAVESYAWHRRLLASREAQYDPRVASRIKAGAEFDAADYIDLQAARKTWIAGMEQQMASFDALIMPTVAVVAPSLAELESSDELYVRTNSVVLRNTAAINMLDGCAISLPCHAEGTLPVGLMVAGAAMTDAHILAVARAVENTLHK
jgi:aspartyl-tRNA(Asn)/glutamyl-tRNA(Gln) amidotransferase subunit A